MSCVTTSINPFVPNVDSPWNQQRAVHLFRRISFGANIDEMIDALNRNPLDVIDERISEAKNLPSIPEPEFAFKIKSEYGILALVESVLEKDTWARDYIYSLQNENLRGRMWMFWHNHFVTRFTTYESASYMYQYHKLIQDYSLGNFKEFVREMGLTPAMLVFLNATQNVAAAPNENYAREVYELFTLGVDNGYTQTDIVETARALTGYTNIPDEWGPISFNAADHDSGMKTIFGRTGNWAYDDVVDILFEERGEEISKYIAGKLYRHFVNPNPNEDFIDELAIVFRNKNWNVEELIRTMFKSEHFFDEYNISTQIYGHIENVVMHFKELGFEYSPLSTFGIYSDSTENGQALFNPVDVAGWPGNRSWINTTSIGYRQSYLEGQTGLLAFFGFAQFGEMARKITDEVFDVNIICRDFIHYFLPKGFQFDADYDAALVTFKGSLPENYYVDGSWDINFWAVPFQLDALLKFIIRIPEHQLK